MGCPVLAEPSAKNGTVAALQAESFNLRRARQEDDMCCGQGVWKERGTCNGLAVCKNALDANLGTNKYSKG